ncbi:MAG: TIGR03067 domain-containing protein [Candidatus Sumerlaeia bacterium]|nr:TIGR03067 domain-containing protein [Candidatus Sumerlaeia bacterium]
MKIRWEQSRTIRKGAVLALVLCLAACAAHHRTLKTQERAQAQASLARAAATETAKPAAAAVGGDLLKQIQGHWVGENDSTQWEITVTGQTVSAKTSDGDFYKGTLTINDRVSPAEMDLKFSEASDSSLVGQVILGIVKVEGGKITFCVARPDDAVRPKSFDRAEGLVIVGEKK